MHCPRRQAGQIGLCRLPWQWLISLGFLLLSLCIQLPCNSMPAFAAMVKARQGQQQRAVTANGPGSAVASIYWLNVRQVQNST